VQELSESDCTRYRAGRHQRQAPRPVHVVVPGWPSTRKRRYGQPQRSGLDWTTTSSRPPLPSATWTATCIWSLLGNVTVLMSQQGQRGGAGYQADTSHPGRRAEDLPAGQG
jgi:hypothetical protein